MTRTKATLATAAVLVLAPTAVFVLAWLFNQSWFWSAVRWTGGAMVAGVVVIVIGKGVHELWLWFRRYGET